ncbi:hypothetical protein CONLIGDRAFT_642393 [Coniochaeta ligniaria NRRL 30616]|uniref:Nephrocystin 3-like N-terminal domain-containing protein n=1 Tax=Coniochaeta ligniaria NRRL 30616 TaxID=1408157 RepID=A0A1J7JY00_9PEZI|nr:hypothetical protein CONLIGDRAFT_642393 [Coniochaeta ligniaria NRRL 30616]
MADPVSIAASIVAFVEIADRVIRACKHCIDAVKDAPRDMQIILGEVTSLRAIIDSLSVAELHVNTLKLVPGLLDRTGPVEACHRCLVSLEALLPPTPSQHSHSGRRRITFAELAWPLKESKARKLLAEISLHKSTLLLAITGDMIHDIKDIRSGVHRLEYALTEAEQQEVCRWLECTNPSPLHNLAVKNHERETGTWLLRLPEWTEWLQADATRRLLWLHGIPGAGKTVLASFLIEELKDHCAYSGEVGQAYYYCHYSHDNDETAPFLRWIISQLCRQARWVPHQLCELYSMGCDPSIPELENALEAALTRFKTFYVVIDAVDESSPRDDLLTVITTLAIDKRFHNLKILATSRLYSDIERMLQGVSISISMSNASVDIDIRRMVHSRLHASRRLRRFSHLFDHVEDTLVAGAHGMFRWAHCQLYQIEQLREESQLLSAIKNLPKDLAETYARGLNDIPVGDRPFVRRVFIWICGHAHAPWLTERGINAHVLLSAVAYDLGLRADTYTIDDLKELCGCLIYVSADSASQEPSSRPEELESAGKPLPRNDHLPSRYWPAGNKEQDSTPLADTELFVSLAHYTVREYLESPLILETNTAIFSLPPTTTLFEFTQSVLRQALDSDPTSSATDWIVDREAYCLTLACAIYHADMIARPDIQDLFLEYLNPNKPHYRRISVIQQRLLENFDDNSRHYFLQYLPTRVLSRSTMDKAPDCIATLLNIILIYGQSPGRDDLVDRCLCAYAVEDERHLSETILVVTFRLLKDELKFCHHKDELRENPEITSSSSSMWEEVTFRGTISDIVAQW